MTRIANFLSMAALAAMTLAPSGMAAAPRINLGTDRTRYSWKARTPVDPKVKAMRAEIDTWNAAVEAKNRAKGKRA